MIREIKEQTLCLDGRIYTPSDVLMQTEEEQLTLPEAHRDLFLFLRCWFSDEETMLLHTSGSTGTPKAIRVKKTHMVNSAVMTCRFLGLREGDRALLCMNLRYIGAMMMVVRSLVAGLQLCVRRASGHPLCDVALPQELIAMVPLQLYNTLQDPRERARLAQARHVIIGGGAVDAELQAAVQSLDTRIYSSYAMTETVSHIALRALNGPTASDRYYPFDGVHISLSAEGTLVIDAPELCQGQLVTHDMAQIFDDGGFIITGRRDNIINSGGVKLQIEQLESELRPLVEGDFAVSHTPDAKLGQAVTLLLTRKTDTVRLLKKLDGTVPPYHFPRHIRFVEAIPRTGNGKIDRAACARICKEHQ